MPWVPLPSKFPMAWPVGAQPDQRAGREKRDVGVFASLLASPQFVLSCVPLPKAAASARWPTLKATVLVDLGCSRHRSLLLDLGALPFLIGLPEPCPHLVTSLFLKLSPLLCCLALSPAPQH